MRRISSELSEAVAVVLILGVVVAVALVGLALVRRRVPYDRLARHTDVAGYVYAVLGVIYGVILAQVVVAAWDQYQTAETVANVEANAVLSMARLAQVLPEDDRTEVVAALRTYAQQVIAVEWPAMERGDLASPLHSPYVYPLWQAVLAASTRPGAVNAVSTELLQQLDVLGGARRGRVLLGDSGLPITMRLTLILGAVIIVGFSYLFVVDDTRLQAVITVSLSALVALLLILEFQLETPFQGVSELKPTAMEIVVQEIDAIAGERTAPP
jgi:hypothetical protein